MRKVSGRKNGFLLVEVLIASFLLAVVFGAALLLYQRGVVSWLRTRDRVEVQENLRLGLDRMSRELRGALYLVEAKPDSVTFFSSDEKYISYYVRYSDTAKCYQLLRGVGGTANPVASYVTALEITYEPAETADPKEITFVHIRLTGEKGRSGPVTMSTGVHLRSV